MIADSVPVNKKIHLLLCFAVMNVGKLKLLLCFIPAVLLVNCGSPGTPLPPSLELPRPVTDLHATRKGATVSLTWTTPTKTTDQRNLLQSGTTEVCRAAAPIQQCGSPVARIPFPKPVTSKNPSARPQTYVDLLPTTLQSNQSGSKIFYAVNVLNAYGRSAGLSNQAQVPAAPTLPPPADFQAQLSADGVRLVWKEVHNPPSVAGLRFVYRVYRQQAGAAGQMVAGEVPVADGPSSPALVDSSFEWEKTYEYHATVVTLISAADGTEQRVEGDDTPSVKIVAHDVFPPAVPTGLQAVFSGPGQKPFIDLVWSPNTETDLAGYNVYRHELGSPDTKLNSEPVKSPAFRDAQILAGHQYEYSVTATDVRGNESSHSQAATESVPAQ
jgi:hypothetical protein